MQNEVMFAGFGGQGILLIGKLLAHAAMTQGDQVAWIPSYGPEMRGGTAYCTVVISKQPIGSPIISNPKHLVAMNQPSLEKFAPKVKPGGIILINSSLITIDSGRIDVSELKIPAMDIAMALGNAKVANIVALGAFAQSSRIVPIDLVKSCLEHEFLSKSKLLALNLSALDAGINAVQQN